MELKNKLKILMVIKSLKFWSWTENACVTVWNYLSSQGGCDVSYFLFYKEKNAYSHEWDEFCLWEKPDFLLWKLLRIFIWLLKLLKLCKTNKIDVMIAYMGSGILIALLSKLFRNKSKLYITIHRSLSDFPRIIVKLFAYFSNKYSDKIIVLTGSERDNLINSYYVDRKKVLVIPNSIDIEKIVSLSKEPLENYERIFNSKTFSFITVGRLEKIKNQELMVKIFTKLNEKYKNIQLIILWDWVEKTNLQKIANNNVYFLWNQENVFKFLNKSDCFLLTSKSESFSIAILEAMACNLPIISTKTQWPREILDNGKYWILVHEDEYDLYQKMERILLDEDFRLYYTKKSKERVKMYHKDYVMKLRENLFK